MKFLSLPKKKKKKQLWYDCVILVVEVNLQKNKGLIAVFLANTVAIIFFLVKNISFLQCWQHGLGLNTLI